jgi:NhaP-type Na+/H+ or K+/H+ antiporter
MLLKTGGCSKIFFLSSLQKVPHGAMFVTTTIAMVYWTVFVQGITIKPLVRFLNVKTSTVSGPWAVRTNFV